MTHYLHDALETIDKALDEVRFGAGIDASGMSHDDVRDTMRLAWKVIQRIQGVALLPMVAEADRQRMSRHPHYSSASSSRDLIAGWLRCSPATAGRMLKTAKHCVSGSFGQTGQALAAGEIDTEHARAVVDSVRRLPVEVVDREQRIAAETTMLDTAKTTDAEVTGLAGRRLLELVAPDAAAEYADRQAERDRVRAESARWLEVTGFGIAGAKELRFRAESSVIDTFTRLLTSLIESSAIDQAPVDSPPANTWTPGLGPDNRGPNSSLGDNGPDSSDPGPGNSRVAANGSVEPAPGDNRPIGNGPVRNAPTDDEPADTEPSGQAPTGNASTSNASTSNASTSNASTSNASTSNASTSNASTSNASAGNASAGNGSAGNGSGLVAVRSPELPIGGAPGTAAEAGIPLAPVERRRADAAVEVIEAFARPGLVDELDANELRELAALLERTGRVARTVRGNSADAGGRDTGGQLRKASAMAVDNDEIDIGGQVILDTCDEAARPAGSGGARAASGRAASGRATPGRATPGRPSPGRATRDTRPVRGERPSLIVLADYDLATQRIRAGTASGPGAPPRTMSPVEVELLACEAEVAPVWMTKGVRPVAVASVNRFFRGKQLTALIARDGGCAFPGCSRGLRYSHAHHIVPFSKGGRTTVDNGVLVCSAHHRIVHTPGGWTVRLGDDGLPEFVPPRWIDPDRTPQRHVRFQTKLTRAA